LHAELGAANGADIAGGPAAKHDHVEGSHDYPGKR
jgi:hypothetical protein